MRRAECVSDSRFGDVRIGMAEKAGGAAKAAGMTAVAVGAAAVGGATFAGQRIMDVGGSAVGSISEGASSMVSRVSASIEVQTSHASI